MRARTELKTVEIDGRLYVLARGRRGWRMVSNAAPEPDRVLRDADLGELFGIEMQ